MEGSSGDVPAGAGRDRPFRYDVPSYERLLRRVRAPDRPFVGFDDREDGVVLHHDVELSLDRALTMARLEATLRVEGTYCVPLDAPLQHTSTVTFAHTVRTLSQLGHEVGLQFDARAHWDELPSDAAVRKRVEDRREVLGRLIDEPVEVVSFRRPCERLRTLELDGPVNACRSPDLPGYRCVSDREWSDAGPFPGGVPDRFRLLLHPGLWNATARSEADLLAGYRRTAHQRVDSHFDAFDTSPPGD